MSRDNAMNFESWNTKGACVLQTELTSNSGACFDQVKLAPSDYLLVLDSPNRLEARGAYSLPHSGTLAEMPGEASPR
jgi:hypothetical protein